MPIASFSPQLVLASRSPRRLQLLAEAGLDVGMVVTDPPHDDPATPDARPDQSAADFAATTAMQKARSVAALKRFDHALILAADTVCVGRDGGLIGKPKGRADSLSMLRAFVGGTHDVVTGVALLRLDGQGHVMDEESWSDAAAVTWGPLADTALIDYADSLAWQGKAGGYNLSERVAAGWPISVLGDPSTVMGLPMVRLIPQLEALGVRAFNVKQAAAPTYAEDTP